MKVTDIHPESPLFGYVRPGFKLVSINGHRIRDVIDFRYRIVDEEVAMKFEGETGKALEFTFEEPTEDELGLTFDDTKVRVCKNKCVFCFVHQQPKGMRAALHVMDEDYRLSFTHGNFITLSNQTDKDLARILEQRLSPLYISVHATDDKLRRCMMRNQKLKPIIPSIKQLIDGGISIHSQVVLCPGWNDGDQLKRTVEELGELAPDVMTLAVVPVGLTKYRRNLAELRTYRKEEAEEIIDYIEERQQQFLREVSTRWVWPADEFYVLAERPVPRLSEYEEMEQFENGVGMIREFMTVFNRRRTRLKSLKSDKRLMMLTGGSAYPFLSNDLLPYVKDTLNLDVSLERVENVFWGQTVTVSGLLTGQDLLDVAKEKRDQYDVLAIPPNCLNNDDLFLDDISLTDFQQQVGKPVIVGSYNFSETLQEAFG